MSSTVAIKKFYIILRSKFYSFMLTKLLYSYSEYIICSSVAMHNMPFHISMCWHMQVLTESRRYLETPHINTSISTRILNLHIPVFVHFSSVSRHQASEQMVLTLLHSVFSFQIISVTIIMAKATLLLVNIIHLLYSMVKIFCVLNFIMSHH